jgi:hypothetical protein
MVLRKKRNFALEKGRQHPIKKNIARMILHVFNPEHDIALAANLANFTAPHAGRQLRNDLGILPALWAEEGDAVLVDNVEQAVKVWRRLSHRVVRGHVTFVDKSALPRMDVSRVEPWGWDMALRAQLSRWGVADGVLPADSRLELVRQLSHRRTAARLLPMLQMDGTVGESHECTTVGEVEPLLQRYGRIVLKAPWSSSGRGVRFCSVSQPTPNIHNWLRNVVAAQGSVMVEPYWHKTKDFGMEFEATDEGIRYLGLSLFHTVNGAYTGNMLATEEWKREQISRYLPTTLIDTVQEKITRLLDLGDYRGPFGVDMMICAAPHETGFLLHPCVEINLRRTMGHVALALSPADDDIIRVMRIRLTDHYRLSINKLRLSY